MINKYNLSKQYINIMIDKRFEHYYDLGLSIIFGFIVILIIYNMYDLPVIIELTGDDNELFNNVKSQCSHY
jgi:hypothetical protein